MPPKGTTWRAEGGYQEVHGSDSEQEKPRTLRRTITTRVKVMFTHDNDADDDEDTKPKKSKSAKPKRKTEIKIKAVPELEQTTIHLFQSPKLIWKEKSEKDPEFTIWAVDVRKTTQQLMRYFRNKGNSLDRWAVTEVIELGDGGWCKGTTFPYCGIASTLKENGWDKRRGQDKPPVWLVIHKFEKPAEKTIILEKQVRFAGRPEVI